MFDLLDSRSAPTSLTDSSKEQQTNLINGFKSSLVELSSTASLNSKSKMSGKKTDSYNSQLIDSKFNELAKKILEELKHSQYSKEFFRAIDSILKEPMTKSIKRNTHKHLVFYNRSQNNIVNRRISEQQSNYQSTEDATYNQQQKLQHQQQNLQTMKQQQMSPQRQKSAIPISAHIGYSSSPKKSTASPNLIKNPISKSATVGDIVQKKLSNPVKPTNAPLGQLVSDGIIHRNAPSTTSTKKAGNTKLSEVDYDDGDDDNDVDEDEDDDDDEDDVDVDVGMFTNEENDENDNIRNSITSNKSLIKHSYAMLQNRNKVTPITKSKTFSDTIALNEVSADKSEPRQQVLNKHHQPSTVYQSQKSRLNPIVRSNTVTSTNSYKSVVHDRELYNRTSPNEPKSMVLNSRDIGSLYKPHMNYSTSVLGNHRLSDDDEIIIIPTQSPSLVSTSPDGDSNLDELNERFSISRTKSFWEKLSKGNHNKRAVKDIAPDAANSGKASVNSYATKTTGARINERTFDRMDSTGGSNSNYNGSSSGDETGGCYSHQNPTIRELQEMSRQNRLRQTR